MHIPRFILITFIALVVGGTMVATGLLVSNSEPRLGDTIVVTPQGTPPPTTAPPTSSTQSPTTAPPATDSPTPPPPSSAPTAPEGAVEVPGCAPLAGDDDCDDLDDGDDLDDLDDD